MPINEEYRDKYDLCLDKCKPPYIRDEEGDAPGFDWFDALLPFRAYRYQRQHGYLLRDIGPLDPIIDFELDHALGRRFLLDRHEDVSGVSGTGIVAEGITFANGFTVVKWLTNKRSTSQYEDFETAQAVHCHEGKSQFIFID